MTSSPSFLAMQRWPSTCSIEIAALSRVDGTGPFMERVEAESRKRDILLHWGQRNNRAQADLEKLFSPAVGGPFHKWREGLSTVSHNGRLDNFSTAFSRYKGLEITEPKLYDLHASLTEGCESDETVITYDALDNPPETEVSLTQRFENGSIVDLLPGGKASKGTVSTPIGRGRSQVRLHALRILNGNKYLSPVRTFDLHGFATGDEWHFEFEAEQRVVDGITRWYAEINLFSQFISNAMRVSSVRLTSSAPAPWVVRNAELPADVTIDPATPVAALTPRPVMNRNWVFFSKNAATGATPTIDIFFTMEC